MKIAFDEHIPPTMVKVFQNFASDRQLLKLTTSLTIEKASQYYPNPQDPDYLRRNDAPWIRRFSKAGGRVVISGNTRMKTKPHERLALVEEGMVVIFFENQWNEWDFFHKCSLLLHWWPIIVRQIKTATPSSFWAVPSAWPAKGKGKLRSVSNKDLKFEKIERQKAAQPKVKAERAKRRATLAQPDFLKELETQNVEAKTPSEPSEAPEAR